MSGKPQFSSKQTNKQNKQTNKTTAEGLRILQARCDRLGCVDLKLVFLMVKWSTDGLLFLFWLRSFKFDSSAYNGVYQCVKVDKKGDRFYDLYMDTSLETVLAFKRLLSGCRELDIGTVKVAVCWEKGEGRFFAPMWLPIMVITMEVTSNNWITQFHWWGFNITLGYLTQLRFWSIGINEDR